MEILIVFILTLLNGFFALAEIALVSVNKSRIEHKALEGSSRAKIVLKLLANPENFLSSVQVGITLIGIIAGAYGGVALTDDLETYLRTFNIGLQYIHTISLVIVIGAITYFSIVIGELVPKSIAMNNADKIALFCSPIINYFTIITYPFVRLLSVSTNLILKLIGIKASEAEKISEDELRFILKNAGTQGVLEKEESEVHHNLFSFTDQTAQSLMTHRTEVVWIDYNDAKEAIYTQVKESGHSKFIVSDGELDKIKGVIKAKDFFENYHRKEFKLDDIITEPVFITHNTPAFKILNLFKSKKQYLGVVIDEYGGIKGMLTLHDLVEAIVGNLPDEDEVDDLNIITRNDGSWLIDGRTLIFECNQFFQREIIEENIGTYTTISGFMLNHLKKLARTGDKVSYKNFTFEIVDMDGIRIDKVLMTQLQPEFEAE
ncbi:MAG: hemolysin family protein [Bacteroidia bacterium]|jgi:putative hemolysin